ncbi:MAG: GAF domain-containing sensor histidine kinase [Anaerolineae bacterium]
MIVWGDRKRLWRRLRVFPTPSALVKSRLRSTTIRWRVLMALWSLALLGVMMWLSPRGWLPALSGLLLAPYLVLPLLPVSRFEHRFYSPQVQGVYAVMVLAVITLLLWYSGTISANPTAWLYFLIPLAIASQVNCLTLVINGLLAALALSLIEWGTMVGAVPAWVVHFLWLGFIAGVFYHLSSRERASSSSLDKVREDMERLFQSLAGAGVDESNWRDVVSRLFCDLLQADAVIFWDGGESGDSWMGIKVPEKRVGEVVPLDKPPQVPARAWQTGQTICYIPESRRAVFQQTEDILFASAPSLPEFVKGAELCLPFRAGQDRAAISLLYRSSPGIYPEELKALVRQSQALAELLAGAQIQLEERARTARILGMARWIQEFSASGAKVFDVIIETFTHKLGYDFAFIWMYDPRQDALILRRFSRPRPALGNIRIPMDADNAYTHALRSMERAIYAGWNDRFDSRVWGAVKAQKPATVIQALVPLWVTIREEEKRIPVGLLIFGSGSPGPGTVPEEDGLGRLVPVYRACASVLHSLQLREQGQAEVRQMELLNEMTAALLAAGREPDVYVLSEQIAGYAQRLFDADIVLIYDYNLATREFHFLNQAGTFRYQEKSLRSIASDAPLLQCILREKRGWFVSNVHAEPLLMRARGGIDDRVVSFSLRQGIRSFAGLPMYVGNHAYGVICLNFRTHRSFSEGEQRTMELFANLAALGFNLHEDIEERARAALSSFREQQAILLHDHFSHYLDDLAKRMERITDVAADAGLDKMEDELHRLISLARELQSRMSRLMRDLVSDHSAPATLRDELARLKRFFHDQYDFEVRLELDESLPALPLLTQRVLVGIASEGLSNACRHSGARGALLRCRREGNMICLEVEDAGKGLPDDIWLQEGHWGLKNIWRQAACLGGESSFGPGQEGKGTRITVRMPVFTRDAQTAPM